MGRSSDHRSLRGSDRSHSGCPARLLLIIVFFALTAKVSRAVDPSKLISQYGHTAWLTKDGSFAGFPRAIAQTTDGYLWFGTPEGLFRFDGVRFLRWTPPDGESLPSSRINSLLAAQDGSLWVGTASGLSHLQDDHLTNIAGGKGVVPSIRQSQDGTIWFVLDAASGPPMPLCQAIGAGMRCHGAEAGVPPDNYSTLIQDRTGDFWIGGDKEVLRWNAREHQVFTPRASAPEEESTGITGLAINPDGSVWIGMSTTGPGRGLQLLEHGTWKLKPIPGLDTDALQVIRLFQDREKTLWVATANKGMYRMSGNKVDHFDSAQGLSSDLVTGFYEDREGGLWVGTSKGLDHFRDLPVTTFSTQEGLSLQEVDGVLAARDGSVWIGGSGSLDILKDGHVSSILKGKGLPGGLVTSLFQDSSGETWVGVDNILTVYREGLFKTITRRDGTPMGMVYGIAEDKDHDIWVEARGSSWALIRIRDLIVEEELSPPQAVASRRLAADPQGGIWRALTQGSIERILHGRTDTFHYPHKPDSRVEQIAVSADGAVLAASPPGMIGWKAGRQLTLTARNGLPCDAVYGFVSDLHGDLWLNMACGIARIASADMQHWWADPNAAVHPQLYDLLDGAQPAVVPFQSAAVRSTDGRLWFAGSVLLQMVDPDDLKFNSLPPPVHVVEVAADGRSYFPQDGFHLPPRPRNVEIDYTALSYVIPEKVRFRYRLEGHDVAWQEPGTRRQAFYSDLGPGRYSFHVVACNNDGVWNEDGASLSFRIAPAWFQTAWFRILWITTACLLLWGIYRLRVRSIAKAISARFDERLDERTRMALELHDTFLQTVQGSKMVADDALDPASDHVRMRHALERLSLWLGQAVTEGRAALHALRVSTTERNHLAEFLDRAAKEHSQRTSVSVALTVIGDAKELHPIVRDEIARIAEEAIRNACLHSNASQLSIELRYARDLTLSLRDNGVGMDPEVVDVGRAGHFGIRGMKERSARIQARITIKSTLNAGTEILLNVPGNVVYRREKKSFLRFLKPGPSPVANQESKGDGWNDDRE